MTHSGCLLCKRERPMFETLYYVGRGRERRTMEKPEATYWWYVIIERKRRETTMNARI